MVNFNTFLEVLLETANSARAKIVDQEEDSSDFTPVIFWKSEISVPAKKTTSFKVEAREIRLLRLVDPKCWHGTVQTGCRAKSTFCVM